MVKMESFVPIENDQSWRNINSSASLRTIIIIIMVGFQLIIDSL